MNGDTENQKNKHLIRAGALLLAVLVIAFVVPRVIPVPAFLEDYGFYPKRSAENAEEWASLPIQYVDHSICRDCHQDNYGAWEKSKHSTVSCENCHGPGQAHLEQGASLEVDTSREFCGVCHDQLPARPKDFPQVDLKEHGGQAACVSCHNPHEPQIGKSPQIPHSLEGHTECLLCHGEGGIKPVPEDHQDRGQDTCLSCHRK